MIINNYKKYLKQIEMIKKENERPTLLLHACCAPCGCYPMLELKDYFKITILFNNSNIYPKQEHDKRLTELQKYVDKINKEYSEKIDIIVPSYENEKVNEILSKRKEDKEGSIRCYICYSIRYKQLVEYAHENGFKYVCSVMTVSRHKNEKMINKIIEGYASKYQGVQFLYSNFKKNKGLEKGQKIAKENKMYHQDYCGCVYSLEKK